MANAVEMDHGPERRRFERTSVVWSGSLECDEDEFDCVIVNVSATGAMVRVPQAPERGVLVVLKNNRFGRFSGHVVWRAKGELGIHFTEEPVEVARIMGAILP